MKKIIVKPEMSIAISDDGDIAIGIVLTRELIEHMVNGNVAMMIDSTRDSGRVATAISLYEAMGPSLGKATGRQPTPGELSDCTCRTAMHTIKNIRETGDPRGNHGDD